jgi:hypothetical protein
MYSHPFLHRREKRRVHHPAAKPRRPRGELPTLPEAMHRRRTLDEKLDEALELTFPASDAFVVV